MISPAMRSRYLLCVAASFLLTTLAQADVRLPAIFSDHAVLQAGAVVPIWGQADPGEKITVTLAGQRATATADAAGRWQVQLDNLSAGGPHTLTVQGNNTVEVQDVLIGEVWLASGQSNMEFALPHV